MNKCPNCESVRVFKSLRGEWACNECLWVSTAEVETEEAE